MLELFTPFAFACLNYIFVVHISAYEHPKFDPSYDLKSGYRTKSVLCMPVKDQRGRVLAVLQAINKKRFTTLAGSPPVRDDPNAVAAGRSDTLALAAKVADSERLGNAAALAAVHFVSFTLEDEQLMEAFCMQLTNTISRYGRCAVLVLCFFSFDRIEFT